MKMNSKELRKVGNAEGELHAKGVVRQPLTLILENIYDTYNIGGLFRLADGLAVSKVYLCGETATPPNNRIHKASCGTYKVVPWEYCKTGSEAIEKFREEQRAMYQEQSKKKNGESGNDEGSLRPIACAHGVEMTSDIWAKPMVVAIEQAANSRPYTEIKPTMPLALVVGNESLGVTKETLALCDEVAEIPMWGINKSLNVIVSAGIVAYHYMK